MIKKRTALIPMKLLLIRMEETLYKDLAKLAFLTEKSKTAIVREAIRLKIKEHKKILTNSDVVIS